jgi:hypothetical protein
MTVRRILQLLEKYPKEAKVYFTVEKEGGIIISEGSLSSITEEAEEKWIDLKII